MARSCRYSGSGAVMMSELVAGSACTKPPVDGAGDAASGAVACGDVPAATPGVVGVTAAVGVAAPGAPAAPAPAPYAARSTAASFTASAFFRYTTQMLPSGLLPVMGRSSFATSARIALMRA